jgi:Tfp pilus assembly protein PilO
VSDAAQKKLIIAVAFAVGVLAVLAGGYLMVISPKQSKASSLQTQIDDTSNKLTLALAAARRPSGQAQVDSSDLFRLSKAMPDRVDTAGAILDLSAVAHSAGVTVDALIPSDPVVPTSGSGYELVGIQATFGGTYAQVTNFVKQIQRLVAIKKGRISANGRLFGIDSIQLAPETPDALLLKATVKLETYMYSATAAAPVTDPTTTTSSNDLTASGATG